MQSQTKKTVDIPSDTTLIALAGAIEHDAEEMLLRDLAQWRCTFTHAMKSLETTQIELAVVLCHFMGTKSQGEVWDECPNLRERYLDRAVEAWKKKK